MSWLVDYASKLHLLLGIIVAGLMVSCWITKRLKYLAYAGGVLAFMGLIWLLTQFLSSDRKQMELNVLAMSRAVVDGKTDDLMKHIAQDFRYKGMTREILHEKVKAVFRMHKVSDIRITSFDVERISREKKFATTSFRMTVWHDGDQQYPLLVQADFELEGDQWKLKTLRLYNPFVDQNREIDVPFPG